MQIVHYSDAKLPCVAFVQSSYDVRSECAGVQHSNNAFQHQPMNQDLWVLRCRRQVVIETVRLENCYVHGTE